jgi:uncharacterized protein (TIGR02001 family)
MKKRFLPLAVLMALAAMPSYSQSESNSGGSFTVTPAFASQYMFRGVRLGGPSFQPSVEYAKGPWTLGVWANQPLAKDKDFDEMPTWLYEYDFYASYEWAVVPDKFTITPGVTFYSYPKVDETLDDTYKMTIEPSLSFGYTLEDITFSLNLFYDLTLKGPTYEFGVDYTIPVKPLDIKLSALVGSYSWSEMTPNADSKFKNTGSYWQAGIAIPYEFSDNSSLTVGWYYTKGLDNNFHEEGEKIKNPDAVGRGVFNVSFSYRF